MKVLFLVYHTLVPHSGITKKILSQADGMRRCGADVRLCSLEKADDGSKARAVDGKPIRQFGKGIRAKIAKRISYSDIVGYVREEAIDLVYIRYDINSDPFTVHFIKGLKKTGAKVFVEIPTWPYDGEFKGQGLRMNLQLAIDRMFRKCFFAHCDRVVTFADDRSIFGVPTINISNGIDFSRVPLCNTAAYDGTLHILSVANIHLWHGLDRLIAGMGRQKEVPAELHIVGDGLPDIISGYAALARQYGIEDRVKILGPMYGEALDGEFGWANIAAGSLGRHRSGITTIKTLKNREYAARGLAFFYSETDSDFDGKPYVYKVPADESPVDIASLAEFLSSRTMAPAEIRESISGLSWEAQMGKVLTCEAGR